VIKEVFAPHLNRNVKFGRRHPVAFGPHLKLKNYLKAALPVAPPTYDYTAKAAPILSDIMGNDRYGDCVFACGYHLVGVETANAGNPFHAKLTQVEADYTATTGFNPNDPSTDNGANIQDVLNYWSSHGFANGTKILGYLAVDATNVAEVMSCIYLFENLVLGMSLPDAWISPFPSGNGFTWDRAGSPDQSNGHCVGAFGYGQKGVTIATWGLLGTLTYPALAEYAVSSGSGELWVVITPDQLAKGQQKAPNGVAWANLILDFDSIGGHVPLPAPPPPPPPLPPTSGGVSLAQAEAAVKAAFSHQPIIMSNSAAVSTALKALEGLTGWPK
jgi:hypothetical protein